MEQKELSTVVGHSTKKEGFCRNLFLTNPAKGITAPRGRECQSVSHKGNGVIIVDGATWKTKR